jgi:hypothetical protein
MRVGKPNPIPKNVDMRKRFCYKDRSSALRNLSLPAAAFSGRGDEDEKDDVVEDVIIFL